MRQEKFLAWLLTCRCWYVFFFQLSWLPELLLMAGDHGMCDSMFMRGPMPRKRPGAVSQQVGTGNSIVLFNVGSCPTSVLCWRGGGGGGPPCKA
jgi:hypothetical protein